MGCSMPIQSVGAIWKVRLPQPMEGAGERSLARGGGAGARRGPAGLGVAREVSEWAWWAARAGRGAGGSGRVRSPLNLAH